MDSIIAGEADRTWSTDRDRSGNQLVLYMSKQDEDNFLRFLKSTARIAILPSSSSTSDFGTIDQLPEATESETSRRFWLQNMLVRAPLVTVYDQDRNLYVIDDFQSPVVEFVRSLTTKTFILPGRIRAELNYFDNDKQDLVSKSVEFRKWFESIKEWIRKNYSHMEWQIYAGPGAVKFRDEEHGILH